MTTDQWIAIIAVTIPNAIQLAKWRWEVSRIPKIETELATNADSNPNRPGFKLGWVSRVALISPLAVLAWQTFRDGAMTRFDLGVMIFALLSFLSVFIGVLIIRLYTVFIIQAHMAESFSSIVKLLGGKEEAFDGVVKRLASSAQSRKEEEEQVETRNPH